MGDSYSNGRQQDERAAREAEKLAKRQKRARNDARTAWRHMTDEQRREHLEWITHGDDAPETDVAQMIDGHAIPKKGE